MPRLLISAQQKHTRIHFIFLPECQRDFAEQQAKRGLDPNCSISWREKQQDGSHNYWGGHCDNRKLELPTTDMGSKPEQARYPGVIQTQTKLAGAWE